MKIISHYQRDELLHDLYSKEELLRFIKGHEWFNDKVKEIWEAYDAHPNTPRKWKNDWERDLSLYIARSFWKSDNGYGD